MLATLILKIHTVIKLNKVLYFPRYQKARKMELTPHRNETIQGLGIQVSVFRRSLGHGLKKRSRYELKSSHNTPVRIRTHYTIAK